MTTPELIKNLKLIASMGDKQIETLADILAEYFESVSKEPIGFKGDEK